MLTGTTLSHYLCTPDFLLISHLVSADADEARSGLTCLLSSRCMAAVMFVVPQVRQPGQKDALCESRRSPGPGQCLALRPQMEAIWLNECMSLTLNFLSL